MEETRTDSKTVIDQAMLGHAYGTPTFTWSEDGQTCTAERICGHDASHVETETVTLGSGITGEITTAATCVTKGVTTYTAVFENEAFMADDQAAERETTRVDVEFDPVNHATELIMTEAVAPSCLREGNSAYWYCESCDLYFSDAEGKLGIAVDGWILSPVGHKMEWKEGKEPTCMEEGYTGYQECSVCGFINGQNEIPIVDHDFYHVPALSGYVYDRSIQWNVYTCRYGCGLSYMQFSAFVRNDNGDPLSGASVRLTGNDIDEEVITDEHGMATFWTHAGDGVYELKVLYDGPDGTGESEGRLSLHDGKGSGGFGSITTTGPVEEPVTEPSTEQPTQPATNNNGGNNGNTGNNGGNTPADNGGNTDNGGNSGNSNAGSCKYCGGTHTGMFGWLIQLIHNILGAFKR